MQEEQKSFLENNQSVMIEEIQNGTISSNIKILESDNEIYTNSQLSDFKAALPQKKQVKYRVRRNIKKSSRLFLEHFNESSSLISDTTDSLNQKRHSQNVSSLYYQTGEGLESQYYDENKNTKAGVGVLKSQNSTNNTTTQESGSQKEQSSPGFMSESQKSASSQELNGLLQSPSKKESYDSINRSSVQKHYESSQLVYNQISPIAHHKRGLNAHRTPPVASQSNGFQTNPQSKQMIFQPLFFKNRIQAHGMNTSVYRIMASKSSIETLPNETQRSMAQTTTNYFPSNSTKTSANTSQLLPIRPTTLQGQSATAVNLPSANQPVKANHNIHIDNKMTQRANNSLYMTSDKIKTPSCNTTQTPFQAKIIQGAGESTPTNKQFNGRLSGITNGKVSNRTYSLSRKKKKNKNNFSNPPNLSNFNQNVGYSQIQQRPSSEEMLIQMNRKLIFESPAPFISATSWIILDKGTGETLFAKNENEQRQVASLTKIMTCHLILTLLEKYRISEHRELIRILPSCAILNGTSACIKATDQLSIWELLHGMMLPSGNDAAQALAIHFGLIILKEKFINFCKVNGKMSVLDKWQADIVKCNMQNYLEFDERPEILDAALEEFYFQMNIQAAQMKLRDTSFNSSHGMHHDKNYSSALDVALISYHALKNSLFAQIVRTQKYTCESRVFHGGQGKGGHHLYQWQNTNKLLELGYSGLKTGITPSAGPCLAASIVKEDFKFIVVVLNSKTMDHRWSEVQKLVSWAMSKINKVRDSELKPKLKKQMLKKLIHI